MQCVRALHSGTFGCIARQVVGKRAAFLIPQRLQSTVAKQVAEWESAHNRYFGPERDTKNFPHPVQPEKSAPVHLGFIPAEWLQFFYPKTGVTGPYIFGVGLLAYLLSKEIWVVDHGFSEFLGFTGAFIILAVKGGPYISKYADEKIETILDKTYHKPMSRAKRACQQTVEAAEKNIWRQGGQKYLFEAKKENVHLQLEAAYRLRIQKAHSEVKRCLDYQLDMGNARRKFQQEHMVNWVVNNVIKSITPQQEKESISQCITQLQKLATV